ncbi:site-specific integrase [Methylococcus capsulatus]|uniref:tyrosine-type recombinase/integrase n=1 Tax=Methylococcus capsulatus TaxID=414 RepID=UPI002FD93044
MATIRNRKTRDGKPSWHVQIRLKGHPTVTASFERKTDAAKWAQDTESAIRDGRYFPTVEAKRHTLDELIERYRREELPKLRSGKTRIPHLEWWASELGAYTLADIKPALLVSTRNKLLRRINGRGTLTSKSTANRYDATLSHAFTVAMKEWQWVDDNPFRKIKTLKEPEGRIRFLSDDERERLLMECRAHSEDLYAIVVLALSTGARKSEITGLAWADVDLKTGLATFQNTKNGYRRSVPLTGHALDLVKEIASRRRFKSEYLFPGRFTGRPAVIQNIFEAAVKRAGIEDFHFHDLRHSAASYLVMAGVDMRTVAEILGHRDLKMTHRYAHLSRAHVTNAMDKLNRAIFEK